MEYKVFDIDWEEMTVVSGITKYRAILVCTFKDKITYHKNPEYYSGDDMFNLYRSYFLQVPSTFRKYGPNGTNIEDWCNIEDEKLHELYNSHNSRDSHNSHNSHNSRDSPKYEPYTSNTMIVQL